MRPIDADALVALIQQEPTDGMYTEEIVAAIAEQPTIEATPVVHGYWVDHYICSNCGKWSTAGLDADVWASYEPPFCPNCGARMRGDGDG